MDDPINLASLDNTDMEIGVSAAMTGVDNMAIMMAEIMKKYRMVCPLNLLKLPCKSP